MNRSEFMARLLAGIAVLAAVAVPWILWNRTPVVHAQMAESGGWNPDALKATVGVPLTLHLTSDDVVHGFAVGKLDSPAVDVLPGKVTEIALRFDRPGTYTFYCTRWCGVNHWRMRGTIDVAGEALGVTPAESPSVPLYVSLGIDLDAPRNAPVVPRQKPLVAIAGRQIESGLAEYAAVEYYRSRSPYQAWSDLRADPAFSKLDDAGVWTLTGSIWRSHTSTEGLAQGKRLFAQNCAACHGETGSGDGVFADDLAAAGRAQSVGGLASGGMAMQAPAQLTDPGRILAASPALLQGKILRGGMGTGMPSWGPIFTEAQVWDLVAYIYSFQFDYR